MLSELKYKTQMLSDLKYKTQMYYAKICQIQLLCMNVITPIQRAEDAFAS